MFLTSKLRQSHAIVCYCISDSFLRCFRVAFHPLAPTLVKENFFTLTDHLFCFRDIANYIYIYETLWFYLLLLLRTLAHTKWFFPRRLLLVFPRLPLPYRLPSFAEVRAVLYYPGFKNINTTDYFPSDDPFFLLLLTKDKLFGYLLFFWFWTPLWVTQKLYNEHKPGLT